jgi:hypothetical protein
VDAVGGRNLARVLVTVLLVALVVLGALGVVWKIQNRFIEPGIMKSSPATSPGQ